MLRLVMTKQTTLKIGRRSYFVRTRPSACVWGRLSFKAEVFDSKGKQLAETADLSETDDLALQAGIGLANRIGR